MYIHLNLHCHCEPAKQSLTNKNDRVLYTGITNNLERRIYEHKNKIHKHSFTSKYNCHKLVFYEEYSHIQQALLREKKLKLEIDKEN